MKPKPDHMRPLDHFYLQLGKQIYKLCYDMTHGETSNQGAILPVQLGDGSMTQLHIDRPYWLKRDDRGMLRKIYSPPTPEPAA